MKKIKILLVDDHQIILEGVKTMISDEEDIDFVGCASDGKKALEMIKCYLPDIVISDISMPDMTGIELTAKIVEMNIQTRVLILSMYTTDDYIYNAIKAGAKGILPKQDANKEMLLEAIRLINSGEEYYAPNISKNLMKNHLSSFKKGTNADSTKKYSLTHREREILKLYVEGYSNQEVADKLNISIRTVETHKNNIMQKFEFKSTVEMVKFALKNNWITL
ncbi:MAG: response regulator transcription factor [Salinivirgaceae bacterium]|jgi:DNA-binding NarL/FixJ family response regulator